MSDGQLGSVLESSTRDFFARNKLFIWRTIWQDAIPGTCMVSAT